MTRIVRALSCLRTQAWLRRTFQWTVILVPLAYVFHSLFTNWQALTEYDWDPNAALLAGALLSLMLARSLLAIASQHAFSAVGTSLDALAVFRGYHVSALSAYLPGGLYVGRPVVFAEHGVDAVTTTVGIMVEQSTVVLSGMLGSVPYLLFAGMAVRSRLRLLILLPIPLVLVLLWPGLANRALRWMLVKIGRSGKAIDLTPTHVTRMLLLDAGFWLLAGAGFVLLVGSVYIVPRQLVPVLASANCLAEVITLVVALTPGGLGVHEGALVLLLSPLLPAPLPALLAILSRLWSTATRACLWALVLLLGHCQAHNTGSGGVGL